MTHRIGSKKQTEGGDTAERRRYCRFSGRRQHKRTFTARAIARASGIVVAKNTAALANPDRVCCIPCPIIGQDTRAPCCAANHPPDRLNIHADKIGGHAAPGTVRRSAGGRSYKKPIKRLTKKNENSAGKCQRNNQAATAQPPASTHAAGMPMMP